MELEGSRTKVALRSAKVAHTAVFAERKSTMLPAYDISLGHAIHC